MTTQRKNAGVDPARYARHLSLPQIGVDGQRRLLDASVLVVGVGGLGSPASLYLAAAGVGHIGIADADCVEVSNLQRQVLYTSDDTGAAKVGCAAKRLRAMNPDVTVTEHEERLTAQNAWNIIDAYEFVVDATDSFAAKFLLSDVCCRANVPFVHAGISAFSGQVLTVLPGRSACLRCLLPEIPDDATDPPAGPLGVLPGVLGSIQATEVIKFFLGAGDLLAGRLLVYDALRMSFRTVPLSRNPNCKACSGL